MDKLSRREMLAQVAAGSGVAILGLMGASAIEADTAPPAPPPSTPATPPIDYVNVGPLPDMKVNDIQRVEVPDSQTHEVVYVKRASDKDYAAWSARCTHRGCVVAYDSSSALFTCPCHGGQFDNMGNVVKAPPRRPLDALAVKFDDKKNCWVQTPTPPQPHGHHDGGVPAQGLPQ